jgi:1-acyl-sn-glycerol-3-phosphate acyltransferase
MSQEGLPRRWPWLVRKFCWYVRRDLRKKFHAVRLSRTSAKLPTDNASILIVLNHPSWWDPLVCTPIIAQWTSHAHYAAIDAVALQKYPVLGRLGFFPVDTKSLRGAVAFLKLAEQILSDPGRIIWLTAQGEFSDVRKRPLGLKPGAGHLASRLSQGWIVPLAIEYTFWNESTPEALLRFGTPIALTPNSGTPAEWTARIEEAMTGNLDHLNAETMTRDPKLFTELVGGNVGVGGWYDRFRQFTSWIRGRKFDPSHAAASRREESA